jgi:hypothetical protein
LLKKVENINNRAAIVIGSTSLYESSDVDKAMTMIEKVARAIAITQGKADWHDCIVTAREAVNALTEPTDEMLDGAFPDLPDWGYLPNDWGAMIGFVVSEQVESET